MSDLQHFVWTIEGEIDNNADLEKKLNELEEAGFFIHEIQCQRQEGGYDRFAIIAKKQR